MPLYSYRCELGHETERFFHMNDRKPSTTVCMAKRCRRRARRDWGAGVQMNPDPGEQYSVTADQVVRSRRHWNEMIRASQDTDAPFQQYERSAQKPGVVRQLPAARPANLVLDRPGLRD